MLDRRDLSEEVTGTQCRETPLIVEHLDLAIDDHEELVRQPALVEEVLARRRSTVSAQRATFSRSLGERPANSGTRSRLLASTFVDPRTIARRPSRSDPGPARPARLVHGGVPEWTNGTASKAVRGLIRPSRVRITPPPPSGRASHGPAHRYPDEMTRIRSLLAVVAIGSIALTPSPAIGDIPPGHLAIGDSVMLGAKDELVARGFRVNAIVSRQFRDAVPLVEQLKAARRLRRKVIVHLGNNGIRSRRPTATHLRTRRSEPHGVPRDVEDPAVVPLDPERAVGRVCPAAREHHARQLVLLQPAPPVLVRGGRLPPHADRPGQVRGVRRDEDGLIGVDSASVDSSRWSARAAEGHAWKACRGDDSLEGSNPSATASSRGSSRRFAAVPGTIGGPHPDPLVQGEPPVLESRQRRPRITPIERAPERGQQQRASDPSMAELARHGELVDPISSASIRNALPTTTPSARAMRGLRSNPSRSVTTPATWPEMWAPPGPRRTRARTARARRPRPRTGGAELDASGRHGTWGPMQMVDPEDPRRPHRRTPQPSASMRRLHAGRRSPARRSPTRPPARAPPTTPAAKHPRPDPGHQGGRR